MKITRKRVAVVYEIIDNEIERRRVEADRLEADIEDVPRTTRWERERKQVFDRLRRHLALVEEAAGALHAKRTRGRPPALEPATKDDAVSDRPAH